MERAFSPCRRACWVTWDIAPGWYEAAPVALTEILWPRQVRHAALALRKVGRDRSPVAALGLVRGGWDFHHVLLVSTRCTLGRRAVRGGRRPPKLDAHCDHEPLDWSAGLRYGSTAAIAHEPCREAGAPIHGKVAHLKPDSRFQSYQTCPVDRKA